MLNCGKNHLYCPYKCEKHIKPPLDPLQLWNAVKNTLKTHPRCPTIVKWGVLGYILMCTDASWEKPTKSPRRSPTIVESRENACKKHTKVAPGSCYNCRQVWNLCCLKHRPLPLQLCVLLKIAAFYLFKTPVLRTIIVVRDEIGYQMLLKQHHESSKVYQNIFYPPLAP